MAGPLYPMTAETFIDLGLLNDVLFQFENAAAQWTVQLEPVALATFSGLATLELAWTGIRQALDSKNDATSIFELLFRKVIYLGFVLWLLQVAPGLLAMIMTSFQKAGSLASGLNGLNPSSFLSTGVAVATTYTAQANTLGLLLDPLGVLMVGMGSLGIMLAFAMMAGTLLFTLIEALIAIGAVPFLLATAGSRWTARIAEGSLAYVIRIGVKLFVVYLVAGVANGVTVEWANRIASSSFIGPVSYLGFVGSCYCIAYIVFAVPRYASQMVQPTLSFGLTPAIHDN